MRKRSRRKAGLHAPSVSRAGSGQQPVAAPLPPAEPVPARSGRAFVGCAPGDVGGSDGHRRPGPVVRTGSGDRHRRARDPSRSGVKPGKVQTGRAGDGPARPARKAVRVRPTSRAVVALLVLAVAGCSGPTPGGPPGPSSPSSGASSSTAAAVPRALAGSRGWLAFQSGTGTDHVHLVHVDGSDDHIIGEGLPGEQRHPDFSRKDGRIAFDLLDATDDRDQLYVAGPDGQDPQHLVPCGGNCDSRWEPAWSPDGTRLVVSTAAGPVVDNLPRDFGLAVVDVATQAVTPVIEHPASVGQDHLARWSPDGTRLVFWRARTGADGVVHAAVFTVGVTGSGLRQLTPWSMDAGDPDWSPAGASIVFTTRPLVDFESGDSELWTVRPNGTGMVQLTRGGAVGRRHTQPRWTPDGEAVLYTRVAQDGTPRHTWLLTPADGTDVPVLTYGSIFTHPVLQR